MSRNISALDRVKQAAAVEARDWRPAVSVALACLAVVGILFSGYQLFAQWQFAAGEEESRRQAEALTQRITGVLQRQRQAVADGASREVTISAMRSDSESVRNSVRDQLRQASGSERVLLLQPRVELISPRPYPSVDFSAIAVALQAKDQGDVSGPIYSGRGNSARVTWGAPITDDGELIGLLTMTFPFSSVSGVLQSAEASGYLDLRRVSERGSSDIVVSRGTLGDQPGDAAQSLPVSDRLAVGYAMSRPFGMNVDSPIAAVALLVLSALLAVGAYWIRYQPRWFEGKAGVQGSPEEESRSLKELVDADLKAAMDFSDEEIKAPAPEPVEVDAGIFRAYDIRGVIGRTLSPRVAELIGQAVGSEAIARGSSEIVVARDGRLSGPEMSAALINGLRAAGVDVIDIGAVPTGVLYFATHHLQTGSGVMVTGSHNPPDYNGFKIMLAGDTLAAEAIKDLHRRIVEGDLESGGGGVQEMDVMEDYIERIASDIQTEEPLKVVVDCGNGIPGAVAPRVLEEIGCEVVPLYCDVDGTFPNHHPDPSVPENLTDLIMSVKKLGADIGVAFDGDGDRLGVVTRDGSIIYPDRLLMLFAEDVLLRSPGATIIYDVKCTGHLAKVILRHGGSPLMWKTGHSLIKNKMKETNAALAGEMSGHFFFKERWYGFDDGIYAAARLLEILASRGEGVDATLASLPDSVSTPEIKIEMEEGEHYAFIEKFRKKADFEGARVTTIDGLRADYDDGWGLCRCSNTTPCLVLRFDAENEQALKRIQQDFKHQMLAVRKNLDIPF